MSHLVRPHAYTQYIRIFVIVNLTSFLVTRSVLESHYNSQARQLIADNPEKYRRQQPRPHHPVPPYLQTTDMAPKRGENTKKVAGNAKKAEAAAQKQAASEAAEEREEQGKWSKGAKSDKKAADAADKKAQQAAAKAERERLLAEEEKNQPAKPKSAGAKKAEKKTNANATSRGTLNLDQLDDEPTSKKESTINATGIDNALDALSLTTDKNSQAIERHPERRFKAAYKAYEERRLPEVETENPGLRRNQRVEIIRKEFEKSEENPFNQVGNIRYDASKDDIAVEKDRLRKGVEGRLGEK